MSSSPSHCLSSSSFSCSPSQFLYQTPECTRTAAVAWNGNPPPPLVRSLEAISQLFDWEETATTTTTVTAAFDRTEDEAEESKTNSNNTTEAVSTVTAAAAVLFYNSENNGDNNDGNNHLRHNDNIFRTIQLAPRPRNRRDSHLLLSSHAPQYYYNTNNNTCVTSSCLPTAIGPASSSWNVTNGHSQSNVYSQRRHGPHQQQQYPPEQPPLPPPARAPLSSFAPPPPPNLTFCPKLPELEDDGILCEDTVHTSGRDVAPAQSPVEQPAGRQPTWTERVREGNGRHSYLDERGI